MPALTERIRKFDYEKYGSLFALVALFVLSAALSPYFLQYQNLVNILRQVSYTGIIALGMTLVIIAGGIDLSVGSVAAFVGAITVLAINRVLTSVPSEPIAIFAGALTALVVGTATGALNGFLVTKGRIAPFIVTLGTMALFRSLVLYMANAGEFRSNSNAFGDFGMSSFLYVPVPVWVMVLLAVVLSLFLNSTRYGRYVFAVLQNGRPVDYVWARTAQDRFASLLASQ